jgi:hypothetical protein
VRDILRDPQHYIGVTLPDPDEGPSYGYGKAMIMESQREPGRVFINSFAHGGCTFELKHDVHSAEEALLVAPVKTIGDTLCEVVDASNLEADEVQTLIELAAKRGKLGRRVLTRRLQADQIQRTRIRRQAAALAKQAEGELDQRVRRSMPPPDGALTQVVVDLDNVLSEDDTECPPMRRPDGTLVELRTEAPFDLHQLAANGSNAEESNSSTQIPAPAEPLLVSMTPITVERMIERYIIFVKTPRWEAPYEAALPTPYIKAFMEMPGSESKLPHVNAVNTAPMVAANGAFITGEGLDRDSGLYHAIEPALRDCLPKGDITKDEVRAAVRWLCDAWLVDVLTDTQGKLVTIGVALTIIERLLLPIRPAFLISAGLRGGGKTTLCHMVWMAILGRMASAASWSPIQEERREALFAHFRQGVAGLVWDNITNGAEISCPEVEKALTNPTIRDRILGVSQGAVVPTNPIQIFVGNNIKLAGDMASRGAQIRLTTDDPHPEDRTVQHADPIGWTHDHRAEILKCLYTILTFGCRNRPAGQVGKTRFREWWALAGWPIELAAMLIGKQLNFPAVFKATEAQDTKVAGIAAALVLLRDTFEDVNSGWFRARDIRALLDDGARARELVRMSPQLSRPKEEAAITRARDFLEMVAELAGRAHANPLTQIIGSALGKIVDHPVRLNDTTVGILRTKQIGGNAHFNVEVRFRGDPREISAEQPVADPQKDLSAPSGPSTGQSEGPEGAERSF